MLLKKYCFNISSYNQALEILKICKGKKIKPIFFIKFNLINGLGVIWLKQLEKMLQKELKTVNFETFVDVKKNYGLFITLVQNKINYIKVDANKEIIKKLRDISKINKVLINPKFSILDVSKIKNIKTKLEKIIKKNIY